MEQMIFGWHNKQDGELCYGCEKHNTTTHFPLAGYSDLSPYVGYPDNKPHIECGCTAPEIPQDCLDKFRAARRDYARKSQGLDV